MYTKLVDGPITCKVKFLKINQCNICDTYCLTELIYRLLGP